MKTSTLLALALTGFATLASAIAHAQDAKETTPTPDGADQLAQPQKTTRADAATDQADPAGANPSDAEPDLTMNDLWTRDTITGDWWGARTALADHGVTLDLILTQTYQHVVSGGQDTGGEYGGKIDYILNVDGAKLGLWKGLYVNFHAETRWGDFPFEQAGPLTLINTPMIYPKPGFEGTAVTNVLVTQFVTPHVALFGGKINSFDFWTPFYPFLSYGREGFMNANLLAAALPWFRYVQLSEIGFGALLLDDEQRYKAFFLVFDPSNVSTTMGIADLFNDGAAMLGGYAFYFDMDDKPGSLLIAAGGSTREYSSLDPTDWSILPGEGLDTGSKQGAWTIAAYFNQIFWQSDDKQTRNLRLFAGLSVGDGNPSFSSMAAFATFEATGILFGRDGDRAGIGYYYGQLSSELKDLVDEAGDVWGVELYYNAEILPWFHLTGDVQIVQNANRDDNPALVLGVRGVLDF